MNLFDIEKEANKKMTRKEHDNFVAGVLYKAAIEHETEWRKENKGSKDVELLDDMLREVRELGYGYYYYADIVNRDNRDPELLDIILKYIGLFEDEGTVAELVGVVGVKGYTKATKVILENYKNSSEHNKRCNAGFYDNALEKIQDKRYIGEYIELLKRQEDVDRLPFTMRMLGRWKVEEAKPYFMGYLESTYISYVGIFIEEPVVSGLVFTAVNALKYYTDLDGEISKKLRTKLGSGNKELEKQVNKALERIEKNNLKALQGRKKKTCK